MMFFKMYNPQKKIFQTFFTIRLNQKFFKNELFHYSPSPLDKHILGTQNRYQKFNPIPFMYDFNLFSITSGMFLKKKNIFSKASKGLLGD
jgi:hypothetical protein